MRVSLDICCPVLLHEPSRESMVFPHTAQTTAAGFLNHITSSHGLRGTEDTWSFLRSMIQNRGIRQCRSQDILCQINS
jgi:hypothetical protein